MLFQTHMKCHFSFGKKLKFLNIKNLYVSFSQQQFSDSVTMSVMLLKGQEKKKKRLLYETF